jgi:copper chaperone CopZ
MYQFKVTNMTCQGCVKRITQAIQLIDPIAEVAANPAKRELSINSLLQIELLSQQLANAGYPGEYLGFAKQGEKL